jgi:aryl-alcohol dehydrogenase-like predicted oxidoreductase
VEYRPFGKTALRVSSVGLGAWQLANPNWHMHDKNEAVRIVQKALELGCTFFDTAPVYGDGVSETLLGQGLKGSREQVVICTKFGGSGWRLNAIRPSVEASLERLQTDYLDILLLHNPPRDLMDGRHAEHYQALEQLKQEGLIREYGVSLDRNEEAELVMQTTPSQALEVLFNALSQEMRPSFDTAERQGVGLIVKVPLDSGWLSGRYRSDSRFDDVRRRWSAEVIARRAALVEQFAVCVPEGVSMTQAALQFCLAQPGVSTVIPGAKTVEQLLENLAAADGSLPPEVIMQMAALWDGDLRTNQLPW